MIYLYLYTGLFTFTVLIMIGGWRRPEEFHLILGAGLIWPLVWLATVCIALNFDLPEWMEDDGKGAS